MRRSEAAAAVAQAIGECDELHKRAPGLAEVTSALARILRRMNRNGRAPAWAREHVNGYWRGLNGAPQSKESSK